MFSQNVKITSSILPSLIQFVSSTFKFSSYFLKSDFLMTILFLKWMKFSGHNSLKRSNAIINKNQVRKCKDVYQLCFTTENTQAFWEKRLLNILYPKGFWFINLLRYINSTKEKCSRKPSRKGKQTFFLLK